MRELNSIELANVAFLTENDVPFGLIEVTATGLNKSILDATREYREFLAQNAIHDYELQGQGQASKVLVPANLVVRDSAIPSSASLYRPETKKGDPRVWFKHLKQLVETGEIFASVWSDGALWLFNIGGEDLALAERRGGVVKSVLGDFVSAKTGTVATLLDRLRGVADKGFLRAPVRGSTAVGRLLESELGIEINSRAEPDFRGIELKSSRNESNRTTLFAKTPDWSASKYGSSRALLERYGYDRDGHRKLSCTISGIVVNSQGLQLDVDEGRDRLSVEFRGAPPERAVQWDLETLRFSLAKKHNETFWVKAETDMRDGWEYLRFTHVKHTRKPIIAQLSPLLRDGKVTVDFLIREHGDKGYLFKLHPRNLALLFPPAETYDLVGESLT